MNRSLLFLPGNRPNMIQNGCVLPADAVIFDLEDSVAPGEKDAARDLVASSLRSLDFGDRMLVVRINDLKTKEAKKDLESVMVAGAEAILIPKAIGRETIECLDQMMTEIEEQFELDCQCISIIALVETALGVERAYDAAIASPRVQALALGGEDLAADLGCPRTKSGAEIFYSRTRLVVAAKAAGIDVIDTPFTDARDLEGCYEDASFVRSIGFTGKLAISPHHLAAIHRAFTPSDEELQFALDVIEAMRFAEKEGLGAVSLRGKMIDPPVLRQAERTLDLARKSGLIPECQERNT